MQVAIVDIETDGLLPDLTRIWCISIADPGTGLIDTYADHDDYPPIASAINRLADAERLVFHNGVGFDYWAIDSLYPGRLRWEQIWDTLVVGRLMAPEQRCQSLEAWGDRFGYPKVEHEDWSQFSPEMARRCEVDVEITLRLYRTLQANLKAHHKEGTDWRQAIALEHQVALPIALQEQHGFRLDLAACRELEAELRQESVEIERQLQQIFRPCYVPAKGLWDWSNRRWKAEAFVPKRDNRTQGYVAGCPLTKVALESFNPGSRQQILFRLSARYPAWKPTRFNEATGTPKIDETTFSDLTFPEAQQLNRYFRISKQLGQVADGDNAWLKLERNGRVHGKVNQNGAVTGRMTHFSPNMAQVDKKDLRMRAVWVADRGHKLVGCDASGLELRMLAHYLAPKDGGAYAKAVVEGTKETETDAHSKTRIATGMFKRDNAKTLIYGYLYGAGDKKLGSILKADAHEHGVKLKGSDSAVGKAARANLETGVTGLGQLIAAVKSRAAKPGYLIGLDGRRIYIRSPHAALNTLLQGAGAVVMKKALAVFHFDLCVREGLVDPVTYRPRQWNYCVNCHDEVEVSAHPSIADRLGPLFAQAITEAGRQLGVRCPLDGEYAVGESWADVH